MPLSILLNGAKGRMGEAIARTAGELGLSIGAALDAQIKFWDIVKASFGERMNFKDLLDSFCGA